MPNPDDLIDPISQPQPPLRQRIADAAPQAEANAKALQARLTPVPAPQEPILVNTAGGAAAPGNLRDKLSISSAAQQADAAAVSQRIGPPTLTDVITPGTPPATPPAQPGLRERLAARAAAAPGAAEQALQKRLGGGIAQAAQTEVPRLPAPTGSTFAPGAATSAIDPATVFVNGDGNAAAPGAPRTTMPVAASASPSRAVVPASPGAVAPSDARALAPVGPGAAPPPAAAPKAPYSKPLPPTPAPGTMVSNGAGQTTVPNPGLRDQLSVGANQAQADLRAAAERMAAGPQAAPKPDVGTLRQQLGLAPRPPAAAGAAAADAAAAEPGAIARFAQKAFGSGEQWSQLGQKIAPVAAKVAKVVKPLAAVGGAVEMGQGIANGDMNRTAWGAADTAAGVALFTPAAPAAAAYLGGRTLYEGGKWLYDKLHEPPKPAAAAKPAAAPAAAAAPAKPAAQPAAAPAAKPAAPAAARAAQPLPDYSGMAAAARDDALGAIDNEEAASPNAAYYQTVNHNTGTTTYDTRDRGQIQVAQPTDRDRALVQRLSVIDGRPDAGDTFEQDGKTYRNVVTGRDEVGKPVIRAVSVDGAANTSTQVDDASLIRQYDEAQQRIAGPATEDQARIGAFEERQGRRDAVQDRYNQMLDAIGAAATPAASGPVADGARASGGANAQVSSFLQQYGDVARATGEKLGIDPNLLLAQWGHETGWGKSVIPGTNNLGNIKAVKGQAGVSAVDNLDGARDNYRQYADPQAFGDGYAELLNRRYAGAVGSGSDMNRFAGALAAGGYATDPAYATKLQAAYRTVQGAAGAQPAAPAAAAPATAAPARRVRGQLDNPVQILDMNNGTASVVFPGSNNPMAGMSQADYEGLRAAMAKDPALAQRLQLTDRAPLIDGVYMPSNVLAGGDGAMAQYGRNLGQAQRFAVNPAAAKIAEEAVRGEFANRGQQIAAGGQERVATIQSEANKAAHRIHSAGGGVNPETNMPNPTNLYDQDAMQWITPPAVRAWPKPEAEHLDYLKQHPDQFQNFEAKFGPGSAARYLKGK